VPFRPMWRRIRSRSPARVEKGEEKREAATAQLDFSAWEEILLRLDAQRRKGGGGKREKKGEKEGKGRRSSCARGQKGRGVPAKPFTVLREKGKKERK